MTPAEAAEGRRLLEAYDANGLQRGTGDRGWTALRNNLRLWLWIHREELVRCAELATEPQGAPELPPLCLACRCSHSPDKLCAGVYPEAKGAPEKPDGAYREGLPPNRFEAEQARLMDSHPHLFTAVGKDCIRCGCKWMHRYGLRCET